MLRSNDLDGAKDAGVVFFQNEASVDFAVNLNERVNKHMESDR